VLPSNVFACACFLVLRRICCCKYAVFCEHAAAVSVENSHCTCRSRARGGWLAGGGIIAALVLVALATGIGTRASFLQGFRTCVLVPFTCCFHSFTYSTTTALFCCHKTMFKSKRFDIVDSQLVSGLGRLGPRAGPRWEDRSRK